MADSTSALSQLKQRRPELADCFASIEDALNLIRDTFSRRQKLLLCGNGGSAADCQHIAAELVKSFMKERAVSAEDRDALLSRDRDKGQYLAERLAQGLPALALTTNTSLISAISNDQGEDLVFAQQVWAHGQEGDVLLGISTSGNAENVVLAFIAARTKGLKTILLTGPDRGKIAPHADVVIACPGVSSWEIQEYHQSVFHSLCLDLEAYFFLE